MGKTFKTLVAAGAALAAFGTVTGFASTLNLGASGISAGNAVAVSCQVGGPPTGAYDVAYDAALGAYAVSDVTVTSLDARCAGKAISLTLTGAGSSRLGTAAGTVPAGGGSLALTPAATIAAAAVTGVSVVIDG
jgi:hypothetical protein